VNELTACFFFSLYLENKIVHLVLSQKLTTHRKMSLFKKTAHKSFSIAKQFTQKRFLNLHEYQSHQLFEKYGIHIPKAGVATTAEEAFAIAEKLGGLCLC